MSKMAYVSSECVSEKGLTKIAKRILFFCDYKEILIIFAHWCKYNYFLLLSAMTRLSVNINKVATIRNARGGNVPDVEKAAADCER